MVGRPDIRVLPRSPLQFAVVIGLLLVTGLALVYLWKAASSLDKVADANSALSYSDREVAGGNGIVVDQAAVYNARALIPIGSTYRVLTGSDVRGATSLTAIFVDGWFRYFLMPRRTSPGARWVICYGCDTSALEGRYHVWWQDTAGISIGQLE